MIHLVLGGARSGKSSFAEQCIGDRQSSSKTKAVLYVATCQAFDEEMQARIDKHTQDRQQDTLKQNWYTVECPLNLAELICELHTENLVLVDCLTLWLNNQIFALDENATYQAKQQHLQQSIDSLVSALANTKGDVVLVANEVGLGVVPMGQVSRLFVDYAGWLNQAIAKIAERVTLVSAGLPLDLKNSLEKGKG
ncbi:bifunctional adenosylcobinamide kinase/adenosylcobinamide-phosphate guanylyltransferase [Saccharobesus litoralis]|uniref:bifunctional adenosylcobinamide kinase/adenosylcobinamide-phosphate guanylyltransferase n=1 Tax=Saccharobesus litoralis TaxID=2172099 RepID=UPI00190074F1|nr:bifunctional adenosylcobinamide kinase/adenosylcobinamide-phosphate guanylyltransferase [Saccharobesus litoralis]